MCLLHITLVCMVHNIVDAYMAYNGGVSCMDCPILGQILMVHEVLHRNLLEMKTRAYAINFQT